MEDKQVSSETIMTDFPSGTFTQLHWLTVGKVKHLQALYTNKHGRKYNTWDFSGPINSLTLHNSNSLKPHVQFLANPDHQGPLIMELEH